MRNYLILFSIFFCAASSAYAEGSLLPDAEPENKALSQIASQLADPALQADKAKLKGVCTDFSKRKAQFPRGLSDDAELYAGYCSELLGDYKSALAAYEKSLAAKANNPTALFRSGLALAQLERCSEAANRFKEVIWRLSEQSYEPRYHLAKCQVTLEQPAAAAKSLKLALEENPQYVPALKLRNDLRRKALPELKDAKIAAGIRDKMIIDYRTIVAQHPEDTDSKAELARLLISGSDPVFDAEKLKEAQTIAAELAQKTEFKNAEFARLYFDVLLARRYLEEAKGVIKRALEETPSDPRLLEASLQLEIELGAELAAREQEQQEEQSEQLR